MCQVQYSPGLRRWRKDDGRKFVARLLGWRVLGQPGLSSKTLSQKKQKEATNKTKQRKRKPSNRFPCLLRWIYFQSFILPAETKAQGGGVLPMSHKSDPVSPVTSPPFLSPLVFSFLSPSHVLLSFLPDFLFPSFSVSFLSPLSFPFLFLLPLFIPLFFFSRISFVARANLGHAVFLAQLLGCCHCRMPHSGWLPTPSHLPGSFFSIKHH